MFSPLLTLGSALNVLQTISDSSEMVQSGEKDDSIGEFFLNTKYFVERTTTTRKTTRQTIQKNKQSEIVMLITFALRFINQSMI